ncbi:MAG: hypothetical protein JGK01_28295, partial [Microcoleus sp. PH2017_03_ELD_O_A]|nr:hypothetical protein [Microcoleus sp. PH2017_03_ELD_O_A]
MHIRQKRLVAANRRRSSVWPWILSVSISPVLATILLYSVWNQPATAQESRSGTGILPVASGGILPVTEGGLEAHPTKKGLINGDTGILPVASGGILPVASGGGQDAHPTKKGLINSGTGILPVASGGGQDAHPTNSLMDSGTGILPLSKNSAKSELKL